jgi:hypothetical protein
LAEVDGMNGFGNGVDRRRRRGVEHAGRPAVLATRGLEIAQQPFCKSHETDNPRSISLPSPPIRFVTRLFARNVSRPDQVTSTGTSPPPPPPFIYLPHSLCRRQRGKSSHHASLSHTTCQPTSRLQVFFKIKRTTKLNKLKNAYADRVGKQMNAIRCVPSLFPRAREVCG